MATIPEANAGAFADVGLLYGHAAWWKIQVFSTATVQQAQAVARKDRAPPLAQAIALFSDLAARLDKAEAAAVRDPKTKATLTRVLQLAPNHLSARAVLNLCEGTAPRYLSIGATEYKLSILFNPYATLLKGGRPLDRSAVTAELTNKTRRRIAALRPIADRSLLSLLGSIQGVAEVLDEYARGGTEWETVRARAAAIDDRIDELGAGRQLHRERGARGVLTAPRPARRRASPQPPASPAAGVRALAVSRRHRLGGPGRSGWRWTGRRRRRGAAARRPRPAAGRPAP